MTATTNAAPRRRRRWVIGVVVTLVVIVGLLVAGEFVARAMIPSVVADKLRSALSLPEDHPIDVELDAPVVLAQLATGKLGDVDISSKDVTAGPVTMDVTAHARAVGVDGRMSSATARATVTPENVLALIPQDRIRIDALTFTDDTATATSSFDLFGHAVPLSLTLVPSVDAGDLVLTPQHATAGDVELDVDAIGDKLGAIGDRLTQPWRLCLREDLPVGVEIERVGTVNGLLAVDASIRGDIAVDPALQARGDCA